MYKENELLQFTNLELEKIAADAGAENYKGKNKAEIIAAILATQPAAETTENVEAATPVVDVVETVATEPMARVILNQQVRKSKTEKLLPGIIIPITKEEYKELEVKKCIDKFIEWV